MAPTDLGPGGTLVSSERVGVLDVRADAEPLVTPWTCREAYEGGVVRDCGAVAVGHEGGPTPVPFRACCVAALLAANAAAAFGMRGAGAIAPSGDAAQ